MLCHNHRTRHAITNKTHCVVTAHYTHCVNTLHHYSTSFHNTCHVMTAHYAHLLIAHIINVTAAVAEYSSIVGVLNSHHSILLQLSLNSQVIFDMTLTSG